MDRGTEDKVVDVVRNLVCHLKKGYMIVKCRGQQDIQDQLSLAEALKKERAFFEDNPYFRYALLHFPMGKRTLRTSVLSGEMPVVQNHLKYMRDCVCTLTMTMEYPWKNKKGFASNKFKKSNKGAFAMII